MFELKKMPNALYEITQLLHLDKHLRTIWLFWEMASLARMLQVLLAKALLR